MADLQQPFGLRAQQLFALVSSANRASVVWRSGAFLPDFSRMATCRRLFLQSGTPEKKKARC
jgi:hypothetical protein